MTVVLTNGGTAYGVDFLIELRNRLSAAREDFNWLTARKLNQEALARLPASAMAVEELTARLREAEQTFPLFEDDPGDLAIALAAAAGWAFVRSAVETVQFDHVRRIEVADKARLALDALMAEVGTYVSNRVLQRLRRVTSESISAATATALEELMRQDELPSQVVETSEGILQPTLSAAPPGPNATEPQPLTPTHHSRAE